MMIPLVKVCRIYADCWYVIDWLASKQDNLHSTKYCDACDKHIKLGPGGERSVSFQQHCTSKKHMAASKLRKQQESLLGFLKRKSPAITSSAPKPTPLGNTVHKIKTNSTPSAASHFHQSHLSEPDASSQKERPSPSNHSAVINPPQLGTTLDAMILR